MSAPTRGSVAGQPITTCAQTREFDEGFERTFGTSRGKRGRFVYTQGGEPLPEPIEVGEDWRNVQPRAQTPTEELTYGGVQATDGTDISSRRKRREWMAQKNLADADDFKGVWEKAAKERAAYYQGTHDAKEIRETVGRALYERRRRSRRG